MEPYYRQPQGLASLASLVVREAMPTNTNLEEAVQKLPIPTKVQRQLLLQEWTMHFKLLKS